MEVILREDVPSLGTTGDIVKVRPGFARNYLLPRGLAVVADRRNIQVLAHHKRVVAVKRERDQQQAQRLADQIGKLRLVIQERAGEEGKLFGSVTNQDIERALANAGFTIDRRKIRLDEPLKALGEYPVTVHLAAGVDAQVIVVVEAVQ
jgi:large subunit ribosomal protein L9